MAKGQRCKPERSKDLWGGTPSKQSIEYCAQYCKSLANTFVYGKNGEATNCFCQAGTKETGRCVLQADENYDVYQYRYPGI